MENKASKPLLVCFLVRLIVAVACWTPTVAGATIVAVCDRANGVFFPGQSVSWTLKWDGTGELPENPHYVVKAGGLTEVSSGSVVWNDGSAVIESPIEEPGTLLLEVSWDEDGERQVMRSGAVAAPDRIEAAVPEPADFEEFWAAKLDELAAVPANPQLEAGESDREGVDYWRVGMQNIRGTRIHGQLARPIAGEKFPALLRVQWAGVYGLEKSWVTNRAADGWLALNILPHDLPIDEPDEFYAEQRSGPLKNYYLIGNEDRETSYFLRMYLSCYRAVEYLKSRPDWDGHTIVVTGTSQGGQQTFVTAGLHPDVTAALALVPAGADFNGPEVGRAAGFPFWYDQTDGKDATAVRATGPYFDIVNFAHQITCPMLVGVGLKDVVCPPAGIMAAVNQLQGYHELVILPDSGHQNVNGSQQPFNDRMENGWLPAFLASADHYLDTPTDDRWVPTWVTAQQLTEPRNEPPEPGFDNATVRQNFRISIGGESLRVRFSNVFGDAPLTIDSAAVALSAGGGAIVLDSSRSLTFSGAASVTIQPGAQWVSDVVDFAPPPMADLAVTLHTTTAPDGLTGHPGSRTTSYFGYSGEPVDAPDLTESTHVDHWYFLSGVDVLTDKAASVVAILGDSITDGRGSTTNGNDRWPDRLSQRLRENPAPAQVAVLNQGIGGNRILRNGLGPSMLARLDRDVIAQPGVKWLIILEGINDLGSAAGARAQGRPAATAADIIAAFDQAITRAHDHGIKVYGATIMPYRECFYFSEQGEADRQTINDWIRHGGRFDEVIDFDLVARDPANPSMLRPELDTGDHLHLNATGLRTIADGIDLSLFEN